MEMTNETRELLVACREAGYETVAIFCEDKRVPESKNFKNTSYPYHRGSLRLVCGSPPQRDEPQQGAEGGVSGPWPKMWRIVKEQRLAHSGNGYGDCFPVCEDLMHTLTAGCYETKDIESPMAV